MPNNLKHVLISDSKNFIYLALGIVATFQISNVAPVIALLFMVLFGASALIKFIENTELDDKKTKLKNVFIGVINVLFVLWTAYLLANFSSDLRMEFVNNLKIVLGAWLILWIIGGTIQSFLFYSEKNFIEGHIMIIETILMGFFYFFFNIYINEFTDRVALNFGIFSIGLSIISFLIAKISRYIDSN